MTTSIHGSLQIKRSNQVAFLYAQIYVQVRIKTRIDYGHNHQLWIRLFLFEKRYHIQYLLKFGFISDAAETYNMCCTICLYSVYTQPCHLFAVSCIAFDIIIVEFMFPLQLLAIQKGVWIVDCEEKLFLNEWTINWFTNECSYFQHSKINCHFEITCDIAICVLVCCVVVAVASLPFKSVSITYPLSSYSSSPESKQQLTHLMGPLHNLLYNWSW